MVLRRTRLSGILMVAGACACSAMALAAVPTDRRNFIACPILQDTATVPCWLADYNGERYFLGIQTDSGGWSPPWLGHRVLVEGKLAGGPRICGGIPLTSQYVASPVSSGTVDGQPLPNPPVASVMREIDRSCDALLPADPQYHIEGRRGPGPNTVQSSLRKPPTRPDAIVVQPPFKARSFTLTYEFDSELAARTVGEALNAVEFAQAVHARTMIIVGYRGATLLSNGTVAQEIPLIARLRAEELKDTVHKLGLPPSTQLTVRWVNVPERADGISDPERRRAEILVTP